MLFNTHSDLAGRHAFLSASKYHWTNYDDDKLDATYRRALAAQRGTEFHNLAAELIRLKVAMPRNTKTLNQYVNDALGFRMTPEQTLYYSPNAFGTADTISFRKDFLRIHDLKTGTNPSSVTQLEVYAAFFCLEYGIKPGEIKMELRLYQNDQIVIHLPEIDKILHIMNRIVAFDRRIEELKAELLR